MNCDNPVGKIDEETGRPFDDREALLDAYDVWLDMERRFLCHERAQGDRKQFDRFFGSLTFAGHSAGCFHDPRRAPPSTRAATVLAAVGCEWRRGVPPAAAKAAAPVAATEAAALLFDVGNELANLRARANLLAAALVEADEKKFVDLHDALNQQAEDIAGGLHALLRRLDRDFRDDS